LLNGAPEALDNTSRALVNLTLRGVAAAPALALSRCHCCSTRHGYNTTLSAEVVYTIEATLGNVTQMLEQLAMDMFSVSTPWHSIA
jgi:hypothetical protein